MAQPLSLDVARFMRLPRRSADTWQGGLVKMPMWVEPSDGSLFRPWGGVWVSLETGLVNAKLGQHADWGLALDALLELGRRFAQTRPAALEVADEALGRRLIEVLGDRELALRVSPELAAVSARVREMTESANRRPLPPDALDVAGVSVDCMRAFAAAARAFYAARPWRILSDADLIRVESPRVEDGLGYLTVLGAAGQAFGLGFFTTAEEFERLEEDENPEDLVADHGKWSVLYGPIQDMPFGDVELWETHGLSVAGPEAYPVAMHYGPGGRLARPDAKRLSQMEAILLALAWSSEEEIDSGRWTREVITAGEPCAVTLAIPELLQPPDVPASRPRGGYPDRRVMERVLVEADRFAATSSFADEAELNAALEQRFSGALGDTPSLAETPLERAQDLAYRAVEGRGRRRIQLARQALALSPDCADAYVLLAEAAADLEQARDLYAQGVAAGERALGPAVFTEEAGNFWGILRTRPYMRARFALAQSLDGLGQHDEALEHCRELLRLNPDDNQGVRYTYVAGLLRANRDEEAGTLLAQYAEDGLALWEYAYALWAFRRQGDSPEARRRLKAAIRANRRVPGYLRGAKPLPGFEPPAYAPGNEDEAIIVTGALGELWHATPGADRWLARHAAGRSSKKRRRS